MILNLNEGKNLLGVETNMEQYTLIKRIKPNVFKDEPDLPRGQLRFSLDRCTGCKSCELACATEHSQTKSFLTSISEHPRPFTRIWVVDFNGTPVPVTCRHCEDAPCIAVCEAEAIEKHGKQRPVIANNELCQGCKCCLFACPFGVMVLDHSRAAPQKCDLCIDRLRDGRKPACVEACPTKTIQFISDQDISIETSRDTAIKHGLIAAGQKFATVNAKKEY